MLIVRYLGKDSQYEVLANYALFGEIGLTLFNSNGEEFMFLSYRYMISILCE